MRKMWFVLMICLLAAVGPVLADNATVTLTAGDVSSAADIEMAVAIATDYGSHPGTVILDGSAGPFHYTTDDRSINIAYRAVTLRGLNRPVIDNCEDGVFFEDVATDNVTIAGIGFNCTGDGIEASWGTHRGVVARQNRIYAGGTGITAAEGVGWVVSGNVIAAAGMGIAVYDGTGWMIQGNQVTAGVDAVNLSQGGGHSLVNNRLSGAEIAVFLYLSQGNRLNANRLGSSWEGVLLVYGTNGNVITGNFMRGQSHSGVAFEGGSQGNKVHGNRVACAPGSACVAVSGPEEIYEMNKISGNKVW
jgi:nitrous oxidase accessory protein NosD